MAVTIHDVRHIAALARLALSEPRAESIVAELNTILGHMDALAKVNTEGVEESIGVGARGLPVRHDVLEPQPLARALDSFAPALDQGFLLVPRLATHDVAEEEA